MNTKFIGCKFETPVTKPEGIFSIIVIIILTKITLTIKKKKMIFLFNPKGSNDLTAQL